MARISGFLTFFDLQALPFENSADTASFFAQGEHRALLGRLHDAAAAARGLSVLTGPIGVGKTTLARKLAAEMQDEASVIWLAEPPETLSELVSVVLLETGGAPRQEQRSMLLRELQHRALELLHEGRPVYVCIDEAQQSGEELLDGLRVLSNLEEDGRKLLPVLLVGQDLQDLLDQPQHEALRQRITLFGTLGRLSPELSREYIRHRLRVAGAARPIFSPEALDMLAAAADGVPRLINGLATEAMEIALEAGLGTVGCTHVHTAAQKRGLGSRTFGYLMATRRDARGFRIPESEAPPAAYAPQPPVSEPRPEPEAQRAVPEKPAQPSRPSQPSLPDEPVRPAASPVVSQAPVPAEPDEPEFQLSVESDEDHEVLLTSEYELDLEDLEAPEEHQALLDAYRPLAEESEPTASVAEPVQDRPWSRAADSALAAQPETEPEPDVEPEPEQGLEPELDPALLGDFDTFDFTEYELSQLEPPADPQPERATPPRDEPAVEAFQFAEYDEDTAPYEAEARGEDLVSAGVLKITNITESRSDATEPLDEMDDVQESIQYRHLRQSPTSHHGGWLVPLTVLGASVVLLAASLIYYATIG